jgi:threonyl-tRNA synthetase
LQFNYIVCAGDEECDENKIDIRCRDGTRLGKKSLEEFTGILIGEYPD